MAPNDPTSSPDILLPTCYIEGKTQKRAQNLHVQHKLSTYISSTYNRGARNLMDFSFYSFSWGSAEYQEGGREKNEFSTKAFNGLGMLHETPVQQQPLEHY